MKIQSLCAAFVVAVLSACGGGGGGGGGETPPAASNPTPATITCPNGTTAATATACPTVGTNAPITLSSVIPHMFRQGLTIQFTGALDPNSVTNRNVVLQQSTGTVLTTTTSLAAGNKDLTIVPTQILANGQSFSLQITVNDSLGRPVQLIIPFTTPAMVCVDNAIWSNPATFSTVFQDCVAPIGVQTMVNTIFNTLQDGSCTITVGTPLTSACKAYLANGTMMLVNTSLVVNGHAVTWMAYIGTDGKSTIVLLDTNDPANASLTPLGILVLPSPLVWLIGNPSGVNVDVTVAGVLRNEQVTWSTSTSSLVATCLKNC